MSNLRAVLCLSLGLLVAQAVHARSDASSIYRKYRDAVVTVRTKEKVGTGFVIGDGSLVMTCFHVITGFETATVDKVGQAKVLVIYPRLDVAVLKLPKRMATRTIISKAKAPGPGSKIYVIGNPLGFLERTISEGIVGANRHTGDGNYVQISAPISEGSSGSPVFDSKGNVIGMASASIEEGQNLNFAICGSDLDFVYETAKLELKRGTTSAVIVNAGGKKEAWQSATISSGTKVYSKPSKSAKPKGAAFPKGTKCYVASMSQPGWFKVILTGDVIAYIPAANVTRGSALTEFYQILANNNKEVTKPSVKVDAKDGSIGSALFELFETDEDGDNLGDIVAPARGKITFHKGDSISYISVDEEEGVAFSTWTKLRIFLDYCAGHHVTFDAMDSKMREFSVEVVPQTGSLKSPLSELPVFVESWHSDPAECLFGLFEKDDARKEGAFVGTLKKYDKSLYLFREDEIQPFRKGDEIVGISVAGDHRFQPVSNWQDVREFINRFPAAPISIQISRGEEKLTIVLVCGLTSSIRYTRGAETEVVYRGSTPTAMPADMLMATVIPDGGRVAGAFVFSSAGEGSPFKTGDQILAVRDSKTGRWQVARDWIQLGRILQPIQSRPATLRVRRGNQVLAVTLCQSDTPDSALKRSAGEDFTYKAGVARLEEAVKFVTPADNHWEGAFIQSSKDSRLEDGDEIVSIAAAGGDNTIPVKGWATLEDTVKQLEGHSIVLEIRRRENTFKVKVELS